MKASARMMLGFTASLLMGALVLHAVYSLRPLAPAKPPHLAAAMPITLPAFTTRDEPLGQNEFASGAVAATLNYDDYVNRIYQRGSLELGIYIAYWGAGKMPTRDIASHTPDRCWTDNGMTCIASRFNEPVSSGSVCLLPANWRVFTRPGSTRPIFVYFWLVADGDLYDFGPRFNGLTHPSEWLSSVWKNARHGPREHYFIRLTSSEPFESIQRDPAYQFLLGHIARIGLGRDSSIVP